MSTTDNNVALITLHNKIIDCFNVSCQIKIKIITFKDQTPTWINATFDYM